MECKHEKTVEFTYTRKVGFINMTQVETVCLACNETIKSVVTKRRLVRVNK